MEILKRNLEQSNRLWEQAIKVIMDGTQLYSKGPKINVKGVSPIYLKRGKGSHVWDVDGSEYIDYGMAVGSMLLGYCYPAIDDAINKQLKDGTNFSLVHPLEVELANLLVDIIPSAEKMRFLNTGSEATTAAVRIARAYTGREEIVRSYYHGWHDWCVANTDYNAGIPKSLREIVYYPEFNDVAGYKNIFEEHGEDIAAVIMEPIEFTKPNDNFLSKVKDLAHKHGSLLIFDEVSTGFRFDLGGAQKYFNITPDMSTFGKAIANGMPISAVVGRGEIFDNVQDNIFISSTFGGATLGFAAAIANINEIQENNVVKYIWKIGDKLKTVFNEIIGENELTDIMKCIGLPPRLNLSFKPVNKISDVELKSLVMQEMVKRGVLFTWTIFTSFSHSDEDFDITIEAFSDTINVCKKALNDNNISKYLEGEPVVPIL